MQERKKRWWHTCAAYKPFMRGIVVHGGKTYRYCETCRRLHREG